MIVNITKEHETPRKRTDNLRAVMDTPVNSVKNHAHSRCVIREGPPAPHPVGIIFPSWVKASKLLTKDQSSLIMNSPAGFTTTMMIAHKTPIKEREASARGSTRPDSRPMGADSETNLE
jgi:hypothetical protein